MTDVQWFVFLWNNDSLRVINWKKFQLTIMLLVHSISFHIEIIIES